ncbi:diacylglycerol kinase [Aminomonas paucivorans]|uniref:Diacylglycerol kinase n=1 Tax=Aminomonas paucivorans DSM 12260 TaxID=584708 RepID=E3CYP9_9BACT|nr:diacylglycerol kinase [Aminomonas paucivorans]EFQ23677.1 diacylglycerol kinase [Aminomonas paucivorans DSM 12260]
MSTPWKNTGLLRKFLNSCNGFRVAFLTERAIPQECLTTLGLVATGWWLDKDAEVLVPVFLLSLLPLSLELVNSAVETLIDSHLGATYREDVRRTKDMLSASVFVSLWIGYGGSLWLLFR